METPARSGPSVCRTCNTVGASYSVPYDGHRFCNAVCQQVRSRARARRSLARRGGTAVARHRPRRRRRPRRHRSRAPAPPRPAPPLTRPAAPQANWVARVSDAAAATAAAAAAAAERTEGAGGHEEPDEDVDEDEDEVIYAEHDTRRGRSRCVRRRVGGVGMRRGEAFGLPPRAGLNLPPRSTPARSQVTVRGGARGAAWAASAS